MDNTDVKRRIVLVRKTFNNLTGERSIHIRPKPVKKIKRVVARGYQSMSYDGQGHTVGDVLTAKAIPFRFAMITLLKRRGISTSGLSFKYILVKFYNEFSGKKRIDESGFINNVCFKLKPDDDVNGDLASARNQNSYMEVTELTNNVIDIFKQARDKYIKCYDMNLQPEKLLKDEEITMAKASFMVEKSLLSKAKHDNYVKSSDINITIIWIAGIILGFWLLKGWME